MLRGEIIKSLDHDPDFRWRGENVTRIENLSDIVFALALGMLISAAAPPQNMIDLKGFLFSIIPVTAAFAVLVGIWNTHFTFFRRYGLADGRIIFLNGILLFVVLYLAYPLRFAFDSLFAFIVALSGDLSRLETMGLSYESSGIILGYFGVGYMVVYVTFTLMKRHVLRKRELLELSETEIILTKQSIFEDLGTALLSIVMASLAYFTALNGFAGFLMFFSWIVSIIAKRRYNLPDANMQKSA